MSIKEEGRVGDQIRTLKIKPAPYIKMEHKLRSEFKRLRISYEARGIFAELCLHIEYYGNESCVSQQELANSGQCSKRLVSRSLKELKDNGLITIEKDGNTNFYQLNFAFMGHREITEEAESTKEEVDEKETIGTTGGTNTPIYINKLETTTPNGDSILKFHPEERAVIAHYVGLLEKTGKRTFDDVGRAIYIEKTLREVYLNKEWKNIHNKIESLENSLSTKGKEELVFKKNSLFRAIRQSRWKKWIKMYGLNHVKAIVSYLDESTKEIKSSAEGLVFSSLQNGEKWPEEYRKMQEAKANEKRLKKEKQKESILDKKTVQNLGKLFSQENRNLEENELGTLGEEHQINDDEQDYRKAILDEGVVGEARAQMSVRHPSVKKDHPGYSSMLKRLVVEIFRSRYLEEDKIEDMFSDESVVANAKAMMSIRHPELESYDPRYERAYNFLVKEFFQKQNKEVCFY